MRVGVAAARSHRAALLPGRRARARAAWSRPDRAGAGRSPTARHTRRKRVGEVALDVELAGHVRAGQAELVRAPDQVAERARERSTTSGTSGRPLPRPRSRPSPGRGRAARCRARPRRGRPAGRPRRGRSLPRASRRSRPRRIRVLGRSMVRRGSPRRAFGAAAVPDGSPTDWLGEMPACDSPRSPRRRWRAGAGRDAASSWPVAVRGEPPPSAEAVGSSAPVTEAPSPSDHARHGPARPIRPSVRPRAVTAAPGRTA